MVASLTIPVARATIGALLTYTPRMQTIQAPAVPARKPVKEASPTPFGLRMKQAREAKGLSMRGLAEAARTTHAMVSLVESGRQSTVDAETAVRIARVLGVTVEWLVTGEGRPT